MTGPQIRAALRSDHCHGLITRNGEQDACGKPPVARDFEDGCIWPACAYHAHRYGKRWVTLREIAASLRSAS